MREIHVNGSPRPLPGDTGEETVEALLRSLGYAGRTTGVAVAVNGEVVRRSAWAAHRLSAGDRVDVVGAVQGG
jgi:sulfur carrier protein